MAIFKNNPYAGFNFTRHGRRLGAGGVFDRVVPTVEIDVVEYRDGTDKTNQPRQIVGPHESTRTWY